MDYLLAIGSKTGGEPTSTVPPNASCSTRCSSSSQQAEGSEVEGQNSTTMTADVAWTCGCSDDCLLKNSCCMDYAAFCLTGRINHQLFRLPFFLDRQFSTRLVWPLIGCPRLFTALIFDEFAFFPALFLRCSNFLLHW